MKKFWNFIRNDSCIHRLARAICTDFQSHLAAL